MANEGVCDNKLLLSSQLGVKDAVTQELLVEVSYIGLLAVSDCSLCPEVLP